MDWQRNRATKSTIESGAKTSRIIKTATELQDVTIERDQLKFELMQAKRALFVAERKGQDAQKSRKAYEKLKVHCDSLQDSLNFSEKNRIRQKKMIQHLQSLLQVKTEEARFKTQSCTERSPVRAGSRSIATTSGRSKASARESSHTGYNILDSSITSSHHGDNDKENAGLCTHEQASSEPTAANSQAKSPRSMLMPISSNQADFGCLLQESASLSRIKRFNRVTTNPFKKLSQAQAQQSDVMNQAVRWARTQGGRIDISTSQTQLPARRKKLADRPKNSFLAPTQASLRRVRCLPRRFDHVRRPFVV